MISRQHALQQIEGFKRDIARLYPELAADYRGRAVDARSVRRYLCAERHRFAEIASLLPAPRRERARLLDVGIAYGFLSALLQADGAWKCEGLDLEENVRVYGAFAQAREIPIHVGKLGVKPLPFGDRSFDAVILSEVLEHLRLSPGLVFRELHRILDRGGLLFVTTPNVARLTNILKLAMGRNVLESFPEHVETDNITDHLTHIREYTMNELCAALRQSSFVIRRAWHSDCMERERTHHWVTRWVPRWRGNLMVLAEKVV